MRAYSRLPRKARALTPCIIGTFRDSEYQAHGHNGKLLLVLFDTLPVHLDSRDKMLTTFLEYRAPVALAPARGGITAVFFLQCRLASTPWKCCCAVLSLFFTALMNPRVGDAQLSGYMRNRFPLSSGPAAALLL